MKIIDRLFSRLGYIKGSWDQIWLRAKESVMLGASSVSDPYSQHQTVFMALDAIGVNMAQVNFKIFRGPDGEEIKDHPILKLLNAPNPYMCRFQLWEATAIYHAMKGEAFWYFVDSLGQQAGTSKIPSQIWVCNPEHFKEILAEKDDPLSLTGWKFGRRTIPLEQILLFNKFNPGSYFRGFSPLTPLKRTVDLDYKARLYNGAFFDNSAEPMGYLSSDQKLTDAQYKRLLEQFEARHKGVNKAKRVALLDGGLKYSPASESHKDMEFLEQLRFNREEILGTWRVPKSIFSITDDLNYATAQAQKRLFWENTLIPILRYIEEKLNGHFFPRFAPGVFGQFDLSQVPELQENFHEKVQDAKTLSEIGFTGNEINERLDLGFEEKPWRDYWYIPFGMVPAGEESTIDPEEDPEKGITDDKAKKILDLHEKSLVEKRRGVNWDFFNKSVLSLERLMESKVKRYFMELRVAVLKELEKSYSDIRTKNLSDLPAFPWDDFDDRLKKLTTPFLLQAANTGAKNAQSMLGTSINFEVFNPKVLSFVKNRQSKITRVNQTVRNQIGEIVQSSVREGLSLNDAAAKIKDMFNFASGRALTISRTEIVGATNGGQILYYEESGIKKKEWLTAKDEAVRESHKKMDGVKVDIHKNFPNGLDHPGGDGEPEEVINCRCTVVPVIE